MNTRRWTLNFLSLNANVALVMHAIVPLIQERVALSSVSGHFGPGTYFRTTSERSSTRGIEPAAFENGTPASIETPGRDGKLPQLNWLEEGQMKSVSARRLINQSTTFVHAPVRAVSTNALLFACSPRHLIYRIALLLLTTLAAGTIFVSRVEAAPTFAVNSLADVAAGGDLTNGVCETATGNGICTLRAALQKAIAYPGGG